MIEIADLIRKRKWDMLVVVILLALLAAMVPLSIKHVINESMDDILKPVIISIEETRCNVNELNERQISEIVERGIAGYKKVNADTKEELIMKLESSTQNAISIKMALREKKARDILFQFDPDRTVIFEEYFNR